jgi:hypothetical protein
MRNIQTTLVLMALAAAVLFSCGTPRSISDSAGRVGVKDTLSAGDSTEYDLIVFDSGFDYWLSTRSYSKSQYSNGYLRAANLQYVNEWNRRFLKGDRRIDSYVEYDPFTNYDLNFNYKLFMYFRYFEETNRIKLIPGGGRF